MISVRKKCYSFLPLVLLAGFYIWLAAQIPYTHDDWSWGIDRGLYQFLHANENGRYAGNFFMIIMTRVPLLKTLIMGLTFFLIPYGISRLETEHQNRKELFFILYLFCNVFLLSLNRSVWQQTCGWVAGFANFVLSALFLLLWIREINRAFSPQLTIHRPKLFETAVLFVLSIVCQLFIENLACYCVLLSLALCLCYWGRCKIIPRYLLFMSLGSLIGLLISFGSSVYDQLWTSGTAVNGYRQLSFQYEQSLAANISSILRQFSLLIPRIWGEHLVLSLTILLLLSVLLWKSKKRSFLFLNIIISAVLFYFYRDNRIGPPESYFQMLAAICANLFYFCTVCVELVLLYRDSKWECARLLILWVSAPLVIAPLAFTTESGSRLFFSCHFFFMLLACSLAFDLLKQCKPAFLKGYQLAAISLSLLVLLYHAAIYDQIGVNKRLCDSLIREIRKTHAAELILPAYPHSDYLWRPIPQNDDWWGGYKDFYQIDRNVDIQIS